MFAIETHIPVPVRKRDPMKYPWNDMVPGASFFVPGGTTNRLAASACRVAQQRGWQLTTRKVDGGVRVWRVK